MTKILFINHNMHYGGAQRVLINLLKELSKKSEYTITLYLMEYHGAFLDEIPKGIDIKYLTYSMDKIKTDKRYSKLPKKIVISTLRRILGQDLFCKLLQHYHFKEHYDVQIAVKEGISKVMLAHSMDKTCEKIFWVHTDLRRFPRDQRKDSFYYGKADKVICVSDQVKEGFIEKHPELTHKVWVVNNIIDKADIQLKSSEDPNPYQTRGLHVVNIGRLSREKAQDRLIRAHKELIDLGYHHYLHIIGDGEEKSKLATMITNLKVEKTITLWGAQKNPYPFLLHGDMYIHSSINEGLPTVLYEAIYLNTPIISTDVSGVREVLQGGKYGLVVDNNYEGLVAGYKQMLSDVELRKQLSIEMEDYKEKNKENIDQFIRVMSQQ